MKRHENATFTLPVIIVAALSFDGCNPSSKNRN